MFSGALDDLLARIDGAQWITLAAADGIPVHTVFCGHAETVESSAAEFAALLCSCRETARQTGLGPIQHLVLTTPDAKIMIHSLTSDYFLLVRLNLHGNAGQARFEMAEASEKLRQMVLGLEPIHFPHSL